MRDSHVVGTARLGLSGKTYSWSHPNLFTGDVFVQTQKYSAILSAEFSIKDHPFLKEAQQQNEAKLSEFLERISGSKLSI